ncbi:hypothetical protein DESACE_03840 [Desulfurella acetivorans A63]|nr:hypothetical protein DESACE_03840 [Desulfurella acetivorans A63]
MAKKGELENDKKKKLDKCNRNCRMLKVIFLK